MHGSIILPVVLYGCKTRSLTLKEKYSHMVLENWVLGKVFRTKKIQGLKKLPYRGNSRLVLFRRHSGDQIWEDESGWACGTYG
jgi:hypothetical protein